jgi:hypothetical protein
MSSIASPRPLILLLSLGLLAAACVPGATTPPKPVATLAARPLPTAATAARDPSAWTSTATPNATPTPTPDATPDATPAPTTTATPSPAGDTAAAKPFSMNLYRPGDFVAQYTFEWCVGASLQMALNLATNQLHTSRPDQQALWEMARDRSASPFGGANPKGWVAVLNELGLGPYQLVSLPTFDEALVVAAKAMRETHRPVGLVMWRGRHAWVMSGFRSTADPRRADAFAVTGIRVLDPLYPHGSGRWGRSPKPNTVVSPATLARQYVIRDHGRVDLGVPPGYLLVLPVSGPNDEA